MRRRNSGDVESPSTAALSATNNSLCFRHPTMWRAALSLAAILACQENHHSASAFSMTPWIKSNSPLKSPIKSSICASASQEHPRYISALSALSSSTSQFGVLAAEESKTTILLNGEAGGDFWGRERLKSFATERATSRGALSTTMAMSPSRMFLKSHPIALQQSPISSLSSDFFDSSSTSLTRGIDDDHVNHNNFPNIGPQRTRGVLGFALQDHGDRVISSCRQPPSMEDTSTSLHSSTDHSQEQRQRQKPSSSKSWGNIQTWTVPETLDEDWLQSSTSPSYFNNPILNRSPSTNSHPGAVGSRSNSDNIDKDNGPAWLPWMPTITQINALNVLELKHSCVQRGLKQTGNKAELQQRLWDWTREQQHRQRRLMIGSSSSSSTEYSDNVGASDRGIASSSSSSSSANSLGEWARTYSIDALVQKREKIHKEKREGKPVFKQQYRSRETAPMNPTKEYLSKLYESSSSQYSNLEVKEMYHSAKIADQTGDRSLSKQILYKLKEATPHDARIYRRLARMESEEGNIHNAREILQEGIRLHPNNVYLWHGLGQLELTSGDVAHGRACLVKAMKIDPSFPNAYHAFGTFEHTNGNIAMAMKVLKKGLEYCPMNHRLHHALGDLYREAKMLDMAERSFRRALELGPEVSRCFAYSSLAQVAYELGDVNKCRSWLQKAVAVNDGRSAKGWLALARLEESEMNVDAARSVCLTAVNQYEKGLLKRQGKKKSPNRKSSTRQMTGPALTATADPVELKNQMLKLAPKYRSGDKFLNVYRNWARIEEKHGTAEAVDYVYSRASIAFPVEWKLSLDWALFHLRHGNNDRARELLTEACDKASNRHADPYRTLAQTEMELGNYVDARKILYRGALALSDSPDGGLGNHRGVAEHFYTWAVCEWHLENLSRAEVLFDHALRLTPSGDEGSALRAHIMYAIARLEYDRGEYHLAQHCICLCLKENSLPAGNAKVWELWAEVASRMGDRSLRQQCSEQANLCERNAESGSTSSMLMSIKNPGSPIIKSSDMLSMLRKDPWHYKIFDPESSPSDHFFQGVSLPGDVEEVVVARRFYDE